MNPDIPETILCYKFSFNDGTEKEFTIKLDSQTMGLMVVPKPEPPPEWAKLEFNRCPNCPLDPQQHQYCPIAVNIPELIDFFKNSLSYENADVEITSKQRKYVKNVSLQDGISSILGIYMVTSGCPVMDKLRPMVSNHLPFANSRETMYRVISMYLFAQYFLYKQNQTPDWDLKNLVKIYENIEIVNTSFSRRIRTISTKDASINAMIILNCLASTTIMSIDENMLDEIEALFHPYLSCS